MQPYCTSYREEVVGVVVNEGEAQVWGWLEQPELVASTTLLVINDHCWREKCHDYTLSDSSVFEFTIG